MYCSILHSICQVLAPRAGLAPFSKSENLKMGLGGTRTEIERLYAVLCSGGRPRTILEIKKFKKWCGVKFSV